MSTTYIPVTKPALETLVRSNALDVIVLDSVAALVTKAELEGEIGDTTVGAQARLMSAAEPSHNLPGCRRQRIP